MKRADWKPEKCVQQGVKYLDANYPNWWINIDLDNLDMKNCAHCIIGQAVYYYHDWRTDYSISESKAISLGFDAPHIDNSVTETLHEMYEILEGLWTTVVKDRLNQGWIV